MSDLDFLKKNRKKCVRILVLFILWKYVFKDCSSHTNEGGGNAFSFH